MIDFPASPTDGQIFSASNGVVYKYSAAYTSWLAQNPAPPLGGTGDFYAYANVQIASFGPGSAVIIPNTVLTGNAGVWYNTSTGRYTPPAGRYLIMAGAMFSDVGPGGSNADIQIRKNGAQIGAGRVTASGGHVLNSTGYYGDPQGTVIIDANGADFFDVLATTAGAACAITSYWFGAFPLTGMQGPTGGAPGPVVGDFCATNAVGYTPTTGSAPIGGGVLTTILSGNSGGYFNPATGRFTPPAGRYFIWTIVRSATNSAPALVYSWLLKNGVQIGPIAGMTTAGTTYSGSASSQVTVDANGSDYFEMVSYVQSGGGGAAAAGSAIFGAFPTQGMVGPQGPMGPIGQTQTVSFETGAVATGTTLIPFDDTIPQQTEGDQYMSLAITPKSATSKLAIDVVINLNNNIAGVSNCIVALFQDATANALASVIQTFSTQNAVHVVKFTHVMTSGTTSATTFKVRAGTNAAGTTTFNGANGTRLLGGVMASSIVITEVP